MHIKLLEFFRDLGDYFQIPTKTIANKFNDSQSLERAAHKD